MSSQYLIINLRRFGDIMTSAHLVSVLKMREPDCSISFLVYEESIRAANILADVDHVFSIDRKKIITLKENRIFSDAFALNALTDVLENVKQTEWKAIINTSNDFVGCYLLSYLTHGQPEIFKGIRFNKSFNAQSSGGWASTFNDVLTSYKHTPAHFVDCFLGLADSWQENIPVANLKTNPEYDRSAQENFKNIKMTVGGNENSVQIVAIQLKASTIEKDIPFNSLVELINLLLDNPRYYPVLLVAPFAEERQYANELNQMFDNSLVSVEADFLAMNSVLKCVDVLVTPDTVLKHQAELVGTPVLEISLGPAPFLRQGPIRDGNLVLTPALSYRTWFEKTDIAHDVIVSGQDIYQALQLSLGVEQTKENLQLTNHLSLYRATRGSAGTHYVCIAGEKNLNQELSRLIARQYLFQLQGIQTKLLSEFSWQDWDERQVFDWLNNQKQNITEVTQELLGTLRCLLQVEKKALEASQFVKSLEKLLQYCDREELSALAVLFFRAGLEQMETKTAADNMKSAEQMLYRLKDDMTMLVGTLKNFEDVIRNARRAGRSTQKSTEGQDGTAHQ